MRYTWTLCLLVAACLTATAGETGMAFFQSSPRGANVYIDGETTPRGRTPLVLPDLPVGGHKARFTLEGHHQKTEAFQVKAAEAVTVKVELEARKPVLTVEVTPGDALVYVDGNKVKAGAALTLNAGMHVVRSERQGYIDWEREVNLAGGEERGLKIVLKPVERVPEPAEPERTTSTEVPEAQPRSAQSTPEKEPEEVPKFIDIDCWVCGGTGFLQTMSCPTCEGTGRNDWWPCQDCNGEGRVPARCEVCRGKGVLVQGGKQIECPACKGSGKPVCPRCMGTGKLKRRNPAAYDGPTRQCPACDGTGRVIHQKCAICDGTGQDPHARTRRWGPRVAVPCFYCKGSKEGPPPCPKCRGSGLIGPTGKKTMCPACAGTGRQEVPCPFCKGNGWIPEKR